MVSAEQSMQITRCGCPIWGGRGEGEETAQSEIPFCDVLKGLGPLARPSLGLRVPFMGLELHGGCPGSSLPGLWLLQDASELPLALSLGHPGGRLLRSTPRGGTCVFSDLPMSPSTSSVSCDRVCISGSEYSMVVEHTRLESGCWGSHPAVVTRFRDGLHSLPRVL